jgi:hypothetical protein
MVATASHTNGKSQRAARITGRRTKEGKKLAATAKEHRARATRAHDFGAGPLPGRRNPDEPVVESPFGPKRRGVKAALNGQTGLIPKDRATESVNIPPIVTKVMKVTLAQRDDSTLIVNHFNDKSRRQMLEAQTGAAKKTKEKRNPEMDFDLAKYKNAQGHECIPAGWIRRAIIEAATFYSRQVSMKFLSGNLFVKGPALLPIRFDRCVMREDVVRNTNGVADLRFRPEYHNWQVTLLIEYEANLISPTQLVSLLDRAGFSIGIGEWRPQKKGEHGRFKVVNA